MSRDPLDILRDADPVSSEDVPPPPMALAERIMGTPRRSPRRALPGWALAAVAAALVTIVGGTALWLARPSADPGFADGGTLAPSDTSLGTTVTTAPPSGRVEVEAVAYFFAEQTGAGSQGGPFLIPVAVTLEAVESMTGDDGGRPAGVAHGALHRLFDLSDLSLYGASSAIPPGAEFLGLQYDEATGIVTVFVSAEFAEGGGTFSMHGRLAQVVYTATAVDGVSGVRFEVDGEPTTVFGGDGVVVGDPATRGEFEAFLPAILIEWPGHGGTAGKPLVAWGTADVYEATVSASLHDEDGNLLWQGFATATCGSGCRGDWTLEIPYEVGHPQWGTLSVWEESAEDGSPLNVRVHSVRLTPGNPDEPAPTTTLPPMDCSARAWETPLVDLYGLPAAVAETRRAIWAAATTCDWDALAALIPEEFGFSFGHPEEGSHAIRYWQDLEGGGENPLFYLAELLTTPYTIVGDAEFPYYVWPVLFGAADDLDVRGVVEDMIRPGELDEDLTEQERVARARAMEEEMERVREAVIRLLLRLEQAPYWLSQEAEYSGCRVGIAVDGTWRFFIAGD